MKNKGNVNGDIKMNVKMNCKTLILVISFFFFVFMSGVIVNASGSVTSCRPIFLSGEYTLLNDITDTDTLIHCIFINESDVVLDCNGFTLTGVDTNYGIYVDNQSNVTIKNCFLNNFDYAIKIQEGFNNNITKNTLISNLYGIRFDYTHDNIFFNNTVRGNSEFGVLLVSSYNNTLYNNILYNGKNAKVSGEIDINFWNNSYEGNSWNYPNGTGFSQFCVDNDSNEICDLEYALVINNTDYLPIRSYLNCTEGCSSNGGGGSNKYVGKNYSASEVQLNFGYTKVYYEKDRLNMDLRGEHHIVAIDKISSGFVIINVSSVLQQALLFVGETKKFSLIQGYYNLAITLNEVEENGIEEQVNLTIKSINEPILIEENVEEEEVCGEYWECEEWGKCIENKEIRTCVDLNNCGTENSKPSLEQSCEKPKSLRWELLYIIIAITIILLIVLLIRWGRSK